jgi:exosortase N
MSPVLKFAVRWAIANNYHLVAALLLAAMVGGAFAFTQTFLSGVNVLLGFCLLPFVFFHEEKQRVSYLYIALTLLFGIVAAIYHVRMFYFFLLAFYFLVVFENFVGKLNPLILFLFAFMSPFFHQVSVILGFPIRLQLSQWAGNTLAVIGFNIQVEGNTMLMNGNVFEVDEACMGLSMLAISLLMGIAAVAHQYRVSGLRLKFHQLLAFFSIVFGLNIFSNLFRIIFLVMFGIPPEDYMHDVVGITCLLIYVIVPLYFLSQWMVKRFGATVQDVGRRKSLGVLKKSWFVGLAVVVITIGVIIHIKRKEPANLVHANIELPSFRVVKMEQGITKLFNNEILMYVKPIPEFFTSEHTPLLCWKGSGYEFQRIKMAKISGNEVYVGQLVKPGAKLFTAWWYSNDTVVTIDQWDWRIRMLMGEQKFSLINITAQDEVTLAKHIESIFENKSLTLK